MFTIIGIIIWAVYGVIVGSLAKLLHSGDDPDGLLKTIAIGIAGSYIGGIIAHVLGFTKTLSPSGIIFGVVGALILLVVIRKMSN